MTVTIPRTEDEWYTIIRAEVPDPAANWRSLAEGASRMVARMSPAELDREFFEMVFDTPGVVVHDRATALDALLDVFKADGEEIEPEQDDALEVEIKEVLAKVSRGYATWSAPKVTAVVKTAAYQYGNWVAGRYKVKDTMEAQRQFLRRLRRAFPGMGAEIDASNFTYWSLLTWLRNKAEGKTTSPRRKIPTSRYDVESLLVDLRKKGELDLGDADVYSLAWGVAGVMSPYNVSEVVPDNLVETVYARMTGYTSDRLVLEKVEEVAEFFMENYFGQAATFTEVTDLASLEDAILAKEGEIEPFQSDAIKRGLADLVDQVKEDEVKPEKVVDTLRLNVRSYGYVKFAGWGRSRMEKALTVVEGMRGTGLTAEEWKVRFERFGIRLAAVTGRYGEEQNMCPTLEKAAGELGMGVTRHPDRTHLFKGDGLTIRVPIKSWTSDPHTMKVKAKEAWEAMTVEERKAAVVEQTGVHVNWSVMS